ncbi:hypothetical protein K435DRAFT_855713 [Dendrothele bispora CBS 962.96]|uniref:Uncharacterized protein n=1 Tax=Dendrothele bispora (strain CBS 962.96) TaxID=1314807 RepID=A0A4S8MAJ9_DENBC|nr:hypothetical protein K435DRAFT_855713 [Dendrothele bispora CBS 962.96]
MSCQDLAGIIDIRPGKSVRLFCCGAPDTGSVFEVMLNPGQNLLIQTKPSESRSPPSSSVLCDISDIESSDETGTNVGSNLSDVIASHAPWHKFPVHPQWADGIPNSLCHRYIDTGHLLGRAWEAHPDKLIWETDRGEGKIWVITVGRRVGLFWDIQIVSDLTMGVPNATFHKFYHLDEAVDWYRAAYNHLPGHQPLKIIMPTKFLINMLVNDHDVDIRDFDVDIMVTVGGYNKVQFSVQPILAID